MVLKLVGHPLTACTKTVATVLHEKNIPFELIEVDFSKNEQKSPAYLEKQPFGLVPYLVAKDDDGFILYECRAISRYIEEKYPNQGTKLIPTDPKAKALFEQAASIEQNNFYPYANTLAVERVIKKLYNKEADEVVVAEKLEALSAKLDAYDKILSKQRYLAGDEITLADIFHLAHGGLLYRGGIDIIDTKPNVARWFKEISSRPSWQAMKDAVKATA